MEEDKFCVKQFSHKLIARKLFAQIFICACMLGYIQALVLSKSICPKLFVVKSIRVKKSVSFAWQKTFLLQKSELLCRPAQNVTSANANNQAVQSQRAIDPHCALGLLHCTFEGLLCVCVCVCVCCEIF